jgi:hypothetical protein
LVLLEMLLEELRTCFLKVGRHDGGWIERKGKNASDVYMCGQDKSVIARGPSNFYIGKNFSSILLGAVGASTGLHSLKYFW